MKHHRLFKLFTMGLLLSVAPVAHADKWAKIYSCENGAAYIDVNEEERKNLQLVFKGEDMLVRMKNAGFISPHFGDKEYVIRGSHAELRQITPTETWPVSLGGVFYPWDFKKMISDAQDDTFFFLEIEPRGSELAIKQIILEGHFCYWTPECERGAYHRTYFFNKEYLLRDCHFVQ